MIAFYMHEWEMIIPLIIEKFVQETALSSISELSFMSRQVWIAASLHMSHLTMEKWLDLFKY